MDENLTRQERRQWLFSLSLSRLKIIICGLSTDIYITGYYDEKSPWWNISACLLPPLKISCHLSCEALRDQWRKRTQVGTSVSIEEGTSHALPAGRNPGCMCSMKIFQGEWSSIIDGHEHNSNSKFSSSSGSRLAAQWNSIISGMFTFILTASSNRRR